MPWTDELETKFSLSASDFEHLQRLGKAAASVRQLNVYFDRAWRLASRAITFRVRLSEGAEPVLTLKIPVGVLGERRHMQEYHCQVAHLWLETSSPCEIDVDRDLPPEIGDVLLQMGLNRLERLGETRTVRHTVSVEGVGEFELDEVSLPDGTRFFEAEIDDSDETRHGRLTEWLRTAAPTARPSLLSKFQRFRNAVDVSNTA
jgi:hypothetical protein